MHDKDIRELIHACTSAVLPFSLGMEDYTPSSIPSEEENTTLQSGAPISAASCSKKIPKYFEIALKTAQRLNKRHLFLLGVGDGSLPDFLAENLPEKIVMTVIERNPSSARHAIQNGKLQWLQSANHHRLLCDTSKWALAVILWQAGITADMTTMIINAAQNEGAKAHIREWQKEFMYAVPLMPLSPDDDIQRHKIKLHTDTVRSTCNIQCASKPLVSGHNTIPFESQPENAPLTVAAILHPDEPNITEFFQHIPHTVRTPWGEPLVREIVVVWDSNTVPADAPNHPHLPVKHFARPLQHNFAEQRNTAITHCRSEWILMLDGDERFSEKSWQTIATLPAGNNIPASTEHSTPSASISAKCEAQYALRSSAKNIGAFAFCRQTYLDSESTCRTGFGLWPDLQIRLFRNNGSRFVNPIHEKLDNISGSTVICLTAPILHYSHLLKTKAQLAQKLEHFNESTSTTLHKLSEEYPSIQSIVFEKLAKNLPTGSCMLLP